MKLKTISLAVGCAVAAFAGAASALPLSTYAGNASNTTTIYSSGSSALDPGILRLAARACQAGSLDEYTYSNTYAYYCTAATSLGLSKTYLVFHKYSGNGSYNGVVGVAEQSTFPYIDMASLAANAGNCYASVSVASVAPVSPDTVGIPAYTIHSCSSSPSVASNHVPDFGFSDLEVSVFGNSSDVSKLKGNIAVTQIFALPLTIAARNALQTTQISQGTLASGCSGSDTLACMPSLPRQVVASIVGNQGIITNWSQLGVTLNDDDIYIVRRTDVGAAGGHVQSGTQAGYEAFFTGELCSGGVVVYQFYTTTNASDCSGTSSTASPLPNFVMGGSGTSNVQTCLQNHQAGGRGAIGMTGSLDTPTPNGTTDYGYRFIKIDGAAPTVDSVANGTYGLWFESSINQRIGANATAGDALKLSNAFVTDFSTLTILADADKSLNAPFGTSGLASLANVNNPSYNTYPVTPSEVASTPYNIYTRAGNSCQIPLLQNNI